MNYRKKVGTTSNALAALRLRGGVGRVACKVVICMITLMIASVAPASARDVLFLGVTDASGQAAHPEMERAIRSALSTNRQFRLINELETQRILRERGRLGHGNMENAIPESFGLSDSTILIRGVVGEYSMNIGRRWLFWGKIDARMTLKLHIESRGGEEAYQGEISANAMKTKNLILFQSAPKVVHISAIDRSEMTGEMQSKIVSDAAKLVEIYFNSLTEKDRKNATAAGTENDTDESAGSDDTAEETPSEDAEETDVSEEDVE